MSNPNPIARAMALAFDILNDQSQPSHLRERAKALFADHAPEVLDPEFDVVDSLSKLADERKTGDNGTALVADLSKLGELKMIAFLTQSEKVVEPTSEPVQTEQAAEAPAIAKRVMKRHYKTNARPRYVTGEIKTSSVFAERFYVQGDKLYLIRDTVLDDGLIQCQFATRNPDSPSLEWIDCPEGVQFWEIDPFSLLTAH